MRRIKFSYFTSTSGHAIIKMTKLRKPSIPNYTLCTNQPGKQTKSEVSKAVIEYIDSQKCIGCGQCVEHCPLDTLRLGKEGKAVIAYPEDCMTCYQCERICPVNAIVVEPDRGYFPPVFPMEKAQVDV